MTGWVESDGGRADAGFKGYTGDCVVRAICHATGKPYLEVYRAIHDLALRERPRAGRSRSNPRTGVYTRTARRYMASIGWVWHPTMGIGTGCTVHVRADELPPGPLVLALSHHWTAMIDGVVHDTFDPSRDGTRCVYGYFTPPQ